MGLGSPNQIQANQSNLKNKISGFLDRWKEKNIRDKERDILELKDCSRSCFVVKKFLGTFMDLIAWGIIAVIVFYWIKSGLTEVSCPCCTVDMCNSLHGQMREIGRSVVDNGIKLPNLSIGG